LPQGATALDFAYELHTDIGNNCIGAKINHKLVPLSHQLSSGDQVEILTSRSRHPEPDWLNFVTTAKARTKIEFALRRIRREKAKKGEQKLIEELRKSGIESLTSVMDRIAFYFGFLKLEDLFFAYEKGDIVLPDNIQKIAKEQSDSIWIKIFFPWMKRSKSVNEETPDESEDSPDKIDRTKTYVLREDEFGRNYEIANCCKPIPGDDALGFINDDEAIIVHKLSCRIAMRLKSSFGERILSVAWSSHTKSSFEGTIEVKGIDSIGVLNTITKTISKDYNVNIRRLLIEAKDGIFEGKIKLQVHNAEDIQKMCTSLKKIKNITSVGRIAD